MCAWVFSFSSLSSAAAAEVAAEELPETVTGETPAKPAGKWLTMGFHNIAGRWLQKINGAEKTMIWDDIEHTESIQRALREHSESTQRGQKALREHSESTQRACRDHSKSTQGGQRALIEHSEHPKSTQRSQSALREHSASTQRERGQGTVREHSDSTQKALREAREHALREQAEYAVRCTTIRFSPRNKILMWGSPVE